MHRWWLDMFNFVCYMFLFYVNHYVSFVEDSKFLGFLVDVDCCRFLRMFELDGVAILWFWNVIVSVVNGVIDVFDAANGLFYRCYWWHYIWCNWWNNIWCYWWSDIWICMYFLFLDDGWTVFHYIYFHLLDLMLTFLTSCRWTTCYWLLNTIILL